MSLSAQTKVLDSDTNTYHYYYYIMKYLDDINPTISVIVLIILLIFYPYTRYYWYDMYDIASFRYSKPSAETNADWEILNLSS